MITAYLRSKNLQPEIITAQNYSVLSDAVWIDVVSPSREEDALLEGALHIAIPTREEMLEIEVSSRLYMENNAIYMTANMLCRSESNIPKNDAITFIYIDDKLITIRYMEAHPFTLFIAHLAKLNPEQYHGIYLTLELVDVTIDRLADILERTGASLDGFSQEIFRPQTIKSSNPKTNYKKLLQEIGSNGDLSTKVGESLMTFNLLLTYFGRVASAKLNAELALKLSLLEKDVNSLSYHVTFLSSKVNFLLDATLGMVTIEQNNVIKVFTVAATMFLPPTLIASIYGMNFEHMPELAWHYSYPVVLALMALSAWLPYKILKWKKWL